MPKSNNISLVETDSKMDKSITFETTESLRETIESMQEETLNELEGIWRDIGLKEHIMKKRFGAIFKRTKDLYESMVNEATAERSELLETIENLTRELYSLRKRLGITGLIEGYDEPFLEVKENMLKQRHEYQNKIEIVMVRIKKLLTDESRLCSQLGRTPKGITTNPLPPDTEVDEYENYVDELRRVVFNHEEEFFELREEIKNMLEDLGQKPISEFHRSIVTCSSKTVPITDENMNLLRNWHATLKSEVNEKMAYASELREQLCSLWELLEENPEYRSKFINENTGFTNHTVDKIHLEIERCKEKKRENIKVFIDKLRAEIKDYWDKCMYSEKQRHDFTLYRSECYNEDMLMLHELHLKKLKVYYTENQKIFDLLSKWKELLQRCFYLAERGNCQDRYKNRGGELLKEEKERKQTTQKMNQIEKTVLSLVKEYEAAKDCQFLVYDKSVEEMFEQELKEYKESQSSKLSARKTARQTALTPSKCGKSLLKASTTSHLTGTSTMLTSVSKNNGTKRKLLTLTPKSVQPKRTKLTPNTRAVVAGSATSVKASTNLGRRDSGRKVKVTVAARRKLYPTRRSIDGISPAIKRGPKPDPVTTEYKLFEKGVSIRSSLFQGQKENPISRLAVPGMASAEEDFKLKTPQKPKTPQQPVRTPIRTNNNGTQRSPLTPRTKNRLHTVSPLPLIF